MSARLTAATGPFDSHLISGLKFFSHAASAIVVVVGCLVLLGWILDITLLKSVLPGLVTMKANTALAFVLAGVSLWFLHAAQSDRRAFRLAQVCALAMALLGLLNIGEYLLDLDIDIDQLLFRDPALAGPVPPGRMAFSTALNFLLLGCALLLLTTDGLRRAVSAQFLALFAALTALLALVGYAYNVASLYSFGPYSAMALHTAFAFLVLSAGILAARPDRGLMALVTSGSSGSLMVRRLLLAALVVPPLLGWLILSGQRAGLYDSTLGLSLLVVSGVVVFVALTLWNAWSVRCVDTQRREAEDALRQRVGEVNALLESLVEGVIIVDGAGRVLMFNETSKQLWQPPGTGVGLTPEWYSRLDMRYPDGRPLPFAEWPINRALRGERFTGYEVLYVRPCGQRIYLSFSGSAVRDEWGGVLMAINVYRDVTQLRELEGLKDEFLEVAAHELKTPVAVLKGYAQSLLRFPEGVAPRYRNALESIDRQTTRIDALVRDLLDVSRLRAGALPLRRESLNISDLVEMAVNQAALRTARHRIQVQIPAPLFVRGDPERLDQVLGRLLDNAIRYAPAGGDIDVSVSLVDGRARVAVRDRGVGIPVEKQPRIFERFYRAHTGTTFDYGGMGVGLYIAREIVRGLGGDMGFESAVDRGSTFYFTLPLADVAIAAQ